MPKYIFFILFLTINVLRLFAQENQAIKNITSEDIKYLQMNDIAHLSLQELMALSEKLGISLDELLNMQTDVGNMVGLTPRETPGIISIITREEITRSGARDLIDVLNLVPGFHFGYDIDGVIGLISRGNWGHEGKVLVLLDGHVMNEGMYGVTPFGNHFAIESIDKIEIIRGPGSSVYGGYAELGVINIVTRYGDHIRGLDASATGGITQNAIGHTGASVAFGNQTKDLKYALHGSYQTGNRYDGLFNDFDTLYNMAEGWSGFESYNIIGDLTYKGFEAGVMLDHLQTNITGYAKGQTNAFEGIFARGAYNWQAGKKIKITPLVSFRRQAPYALQDTAWYYDKVFSRFESSIITTYEPIKQIAFTAGAGYYYDLASDFGGEEYPGFYNGRNEISFENVSAFLHAIVKLGPVNLVLGGRADHHSQSGFNLSPRVGITGVPGKWHYKLLYSQAYRAPSVENINLNQSINPERTEVIEAEGGYKVTSNQFITLNLFDITIKDPIVYLYFPGSDTEDEYEMYQNYSRTGTRGLEIEYRLRRDKLSAIANYAFYCAKGKNEVDAYAVENAEGDKLEGFLKAAPRHKANLNLQWQVINDLYVTPSVSWVSGRYGYIENYEQQTMLSPALMANLFIQYENFVTNNLTISIGAYNILNSDNKYIQPYATAGNAVAPYPYYSREFLLKILYRLPM